MAKNQLIGGAFQDFEGNVLANGYLIMELSGDEQVTGQNTQLASGIKVKIKLDSNGDVFGTQVGDNPKQSVWPNDQLTPPNSFYIVKGYNSNGQLAWGPQSVQVLSSPSPYNVGVWVPFSPSASIVVVPTLETNGVVNTIQTLLNLVQGNDITITDGGNGNVTIAVTLSPIIDIASWWPTTTTTAQNLLHFNAVHGMSFPLNFAGSRATCVTPATASTTINVRKNGTTVVGTIVFGIGASTGTFSTAGFTLAANDYLDFLVVAGDTTLAGIAFTITSTRTS